MENNTYEDEHMELCFTSTPGEQPFQAHDNGGTWKPCLIIDGPNTGGYSKNGRVVFDASEAWKLLEFLRQHEYAIKQLAGIEESEQEPPDLVVEQMNRIESPGYNQLGEDEPYYSPPDDEEEYISGDGSGLHQCPYCYDQVYEEHEEFCPLNPNRNRNIVP